MEPRDPAFGPLRFVGGGGRPVHVIHVEGGIGAGKSTLIAVLAARLRAERGLRVAVVDEPVAIWERLRVFDEFYSAAGGWRALPAAEVEATPPAVAARLDELERRERALVAYDFQTLASATRARAAQEAAAATPDADVFLCERGPDADAVFETMQHGAYRAGARVNRAEMYRVWSELIRCTYPWAGVLRARTEGGEEDGPPPVVHTLYLDTSPEVMLGRVRARARESETDAGALGAERERYMLEVLAAHRAYFCGGPGPPGPLERPRHVRAGRLAVVGPELADADFRADSEAQRQIFDAVCAIVAGEKDGPG